MLKDVSHAARKMFAAVLALAVLVISPATPASATNEEFFNVQENVGKDAAVGQLLIDGNEIRSVTEMH